MGDLVNLNKARKAAARKTKRAQADANAVKFGQTKAEKSVQVAKQLAEVKRLDGHKLDE